MRLVENLLAVLRVQLRNPALDATQAVTALTKLGIATGNAQRLLDDHSDIRIGTLQAVADKLKISIADLLQGRPTAAAPTLERALDVLGVELARDMPDDVREDLADALAKLARRKGQDRDQRQVLALLSAPSVH